MRQSDAMVRRIEEEEVRSARGQEKRDRELVFHAQKGNGAGSHADGARNRVCRR